MYRQLCFVIISQWPCAECYSWLVSSSKVSVTSFLVFFQHQSFFIRVHSLTSSILWNSTEHSKSDHTTYKIPSAEGHFSFRLQKLFKCSSSLHSWGLSLEMLSLCPPLLSTHWHHFQCASIFFHFCFSTPLAKFSTRNYVTWLDDETAASCYNFRVREMLFSLYVCVCVLKNEPLSY